MLLDIPTEVLLFILQLLPRKVLDKLFRVHPRIREVISRNNHLFHQQPITLNIKYPGRLGTRFTFLDESGHGLKEVDGLTGDPRRPLSTRWLTKPYFFGRQVVQIYFFTGLQVVDTHLQILRI